MKKYTELDKSMFAGNFIKEGEPIFRNQKDRKSPTPVRTVVLLCMHCKKEFTAVLTNALRIQQKCCSISCSFRYSEAFTNGNEKHPLYSRWLSMTQRCNNPKSTNFKNYGQRGISISSDLQSFEDYANYIYSLPNCPENWTTDYQVDRIDNDKGYVKGNLRIVCRSIQTINTRKRKNTSNTYKGVIWNSFHKRWIARLTYKGKVLLSKVCLTEIEALETRNEFILKNELPHAVQKPNE